MTSPAPADVPGCLGCDLSAGRRQPPGGVISRTSRWQVNHAVGPLNTGTLVLAPRQHVVAVADLDDTAAAELGPLVRETARVVEALTLPEQTYVCSWAHGPPRRHLHVVVQAATRALVAEYGGLRAEQLQARMLAGAGHHPAAAEEVSRFCTQAREMFRAPGMVSTT